MNLDIGPAECGLSVTIPLTRDEFFTALADPRRDYARSLRESHSAIKEEVVWDLYRRRAVEPVLDAVDRVAKLGVDVRRGASLRDLSDLAARCAAIAVVAHFRPVLLEPRDLPDPRRFLDQIANDESYTAGRVGEFLNRCHPEWLRTTVAVSPEELTAVLNGLLQEAHDWYRHGDQETLPGKPESNFRVSRVLLEERFADVVPPARCLEFCDGLQTISAFIAAIPQGWGGTLDLSMCHSAMYAETIKRGRPTCAIVRHRDSATPHFKALRYRLAIGDLSRQPRPYGETLVRVHKALQEGRSAATKGGTPFAFLIRPELGRMGGNPTDEADVDNARTQLRELLASTRKRILVLSVLCLCASLVACMAPWLLPPRQAGCLVGFSFLIAACFVPCLVANLRNAAFADILIKLIQQMEPASARGILTVIADDSGTGESTIF